MQSSLLLTIVARVVVVVVHQLWKAQIQKASSQVAIPRKTAADLDKIEMHERREVTGELHIKVHVQYGLPDGKSKYGKP